MRQMSDDDVPMLQNLCQTLGPGLVTPLVAAIGQRGKPPGGPPGEGRADRVRRPPRSSPRSRSATRRTRRSAASPSKCCRPSAARAPSVICKRCWPTTIPTSSAKRCARSSASAARGLRGAREGACRTAKSARARRSCTRSGRSTTSARRRCWSTSSSTPATRARARPVYVSALEALGRSGADPRGIDALKDALYRGEWWAPAPHRPPARRRGASAPRHGVPGGRRRSGRGQHDRAARRPPSRDRSH